MSPCGVTILLNTIYTVPPFWSVFCHMYVSRDIDINLSPYEIQNRLQTSENLALSQWMHTILKLNLAIRKECAYNIGHRSIIQQPE